MATYLLLRDNKNSGPYTLEALLQLGLKPYDLVWVEGKSAAWRYPSEVDDLKFYAPIVEEQPYDRFYKKPSEAKIEIEKKQAAVQETKKAQPEITYIAAKEVNPITKNNEIKTTRKQVFVSLPANTGNTIVKKPEQVVASAGSLSVNEFNGNGSTSNGIKKTDQSDALSYSELVNEYNNYQPRDKKIYLDEDEMPSQKTQAPVETKYAQSLDDIKDMYVQTLADRKRKTAQKKMIMNLVKRGLPFAAVLLVGFIMGGFLMNKKSDTVSAIQPLKNDADKIVLKQEDKKEPVSQTVLPQTQPQETAQQQQAVPDNTLSSNPATDAYTKSAVVQKDLKLDKSATEQLPLNVVKKFVAKQNETEKAGNTGLVASQQKPQSIEPDPQTGERNKLVRSATENTTENNSSPVNAVKNGLMKQVKVNGNQYKVGTFGGIHDLELTVVNNSNFLLDHVMVELQYLKPSDQPLKTNNVQFDNVPPNGSLTLAIPATNRGMKVVYKVINVQSKAAGNETAAAGL